MITVWGLASCDTCRKAVAWLRDREIGHEFLDLRRHTLPDIEAWLAEVGHEVLVNRRGTTWRQLPEGEREGLDNARAAALIRARPALMKRPAFDLGDRILVGFSTPVQATLASLGD